MSSRDSRSSTEVESLGGECLNRSADPRPRRARSRAHPPEGTRTRTRAREPIMLPGGGGAVTTWCTVLWSSAGGAPRGGDAAGLQRNAHARMLGLRACLHFCGSL